MTMGRFEVRTDPIRINAPIETVWAILTEVDKYGRWNPFTPRARTDFAIGAPADLLVSMGPAKFRITETVCGFERPRLIAWQKKFGARWLPPRGAGAASRTCRRVSLQLPQHGQTNRACSPQWCLRVSAATCVAASMPWPRA